MSEQYGAGQCLELGDKGDKSDAISFSVSIGAARAEMHRDDGQSVEAIAVAPKRNQA